MNKLLEFLRSTYIVLLFVAIEAAALHCYARSTAQAQARILVRSSSVAGGVHGFFAEMKRYFGLGRENRLLTERVAALETELARYRRAEAGRSFDERLLRDSLAGHYAYTTAFVVSNSINKLRNFIVIDRGSADGITPDMALLSAEGAMAGRVVECSERYSVAVSILNTAFRASGRLDGTDYSGAILWEGGDPGRVKMTEISKYADPEPGDRVVSTGFSQYFPADVPIGTVEHASLNEARTAYTAVVRLDADLSALGYVILVRNLDLPEVRALQHGERVRELTDTP